MDRKAQVAEALLETDASDETLRNTIRVAELYMQATREATTKTEAGRLRRKCQELIARAEKIKAQLSSKPPVAGYEILRSSSLLHGNEFPPWEADPDLEEFVLPRDGSLFVDKAIFMLSPAQKEIFAAWSRPHEMFSSEKSDATLDLMTASRPCNFVQDVTTDCSVVASLSAALEILTGKHSVLSSIFYPFDHKNHRPIASASGKYILKLNFNGCARRVVIDDRLPASQTDRTLFVVDRRNPQLIWPALLEKAYLKVRGGYDFPGSNSGTDLWVLTGWIPEQIFLQREDFDLNETWTRIKKAYDSEDVVITLGTGRVSEEEEEVMGLVGEHDYAVLDLVSRGDVRKLLIKNPWCNGPVWTGAGWATPQHSEAIDGEPDGDKTDRDPSESLPSGTLWVALEDVAQHFESMYLNWNPTHFSHRRDLHFSWNKPTNFLASSLIGNKQFSISIPSSGTLWILVSRHFVDAELDIMRNRTGSMAAVAQQLGFTSILIFKNAGKRVQVSGDEIYSGPYVDSPQTLARLEAEAGTRYTIVLDQQELPFPSYLFTITLFSNAPVDVAEAEEEMSHFSEQLGSWSRRTAGGNSSQATYFINPQYKLTVSTVSQVSILLATAARDIHVHVDLVWASGHRAASLRVRDLVATSGEYRKGCAVANISHLDPGTYTLVCSTFEAGQIADFSVRASSTGPISLEPVPADAAGRLRKTLIPLKVSNREERYRLSLGASWLTRSYICSRSVLSKQTEYGSRTSSSVMIRLSIVYGWGLQQIILVESNDGEFQEATTAVRTPDFDIEPERASREGMWLIVETIGMRDGGGEVESDIFSDSTVLVGDWEEC